MYKRFSLTLAALLFVALSIQSDAILRRSLAQNKSIPAPKDVLGFTPGDDRKLASWAKVVEYFQKLAVSSDRVKFEEIGKSTMGAPFVYATISAPENLKRLNEYKEIQRQLADPRILGSPTNPALADRKAAQLIARAFPHPERTIVPRSVGRIRYVVCANPPAGTVTVPMERAEVSEADIVTSAPPTGAGAERVTVA